MMTSREYLDHIHAGIVIVDDNGRIALFNAVAGRLTGLAAKQVLGRPWESILKSCPWLGAMIRPGETEAVKTAFQPLAKGASKGMGDDIPPGIFFSATELPGSAGQAAGRIITLVQLDNGAAPPLTASDMDTGPQSEPSKLVTVDPLVEKQLDLARRVAPSRATVLIQGESGTGKELFAHYIHRHSGLPKEPYVAVNCAALPETLAESELFGYEKGAFTGAVKSQAGKFELAREGTLVLDEISEMPLPLQAKLLRVIQERRVDRVGGGHAPQEINCRLVAISNRDLKSAVRKGRFRPDLYHRLNVIPLLIPPLRQRPADIALLAGHFLAKFSRRYGRSQLQIPSATLAHLKSYNWPGNVRELENAVERAVLIADGSQLTPDHLILDDPLQSVADQTAVRVGQTVKEMERALIMKTLTTVNENRTKAAEMLGISIRTLRNKLNEYKAGMADGTAQDPS